MDNNLNKPAVAILGDVYNLLGKGTFNLTFGEVLRAATRAEELRALISSLNDGAVNLIEVVAANDEEGSDDS